MSEIHLKQNYHTRRLRVRLALFGLLIGVLSGLIAVAYRFVLSQLDTVRNSAFLQARGWQLAGLLVLLFLFAWGMDRLLRWAPHSGGSGIPQVRAELLGKIDMQVVPTIFSKFVGGCLGNAGGLTLGREGPSIQLGAMFAKGFSRVLGCSAMEERYLITAGASAGLAAAFNAPISGALFAMEEIHKSLSHYFLIPCLAASLVANFISFQLLGYEPAFSFGITSPLPILSMWQVILLGIAGGLAGTLFNRGLLLAQSGIARVRVPRYLIIFLIMAALLFIGRKEVLFLGGGHALVEKLAEGGVVESLLLILLVRYVFVWLSYGSGAQGGIFLPVLTIGAALGALFFSLFHGALPDVYFLNFLYLGMVGILSGVVQAPLMSILLVTEMSGSITTLLPLTSCAIVAFLVAKICRTKPVYDSLFERRFGSVDPQQEEADEEMTMQYYLVPNGAGYIGRPISELTLPASTLLVSVEREGRTMVANGSTVLYGGDHVLVLCPEHELEAISIFFGGLS